VFTLYPARIEAFAAMIDTGPQNVSNPSGRAATWIREELLHLLSLSATLAGLCITVVALIKSVPGSRRADTLVDDMFAACALLFLVCTHVIFWALRKHRASSRLIRFIDAAFLVGLTLMTLAGFVLVYTIW
jgi:hypothetical protein